MPALTERSAVDLAAAIRRRELTSLAVVEAHVARLRESHERLNAVAVERYEAALAQARACDQQIAKNALRRRSAEDLPPLLGVPFTVKESIALEGMPQTAGVRARLGQAATHSAPAVQRILDAGAVPLGVTNVSELALWIESDNEVYGRTNNPYDRSRTAGGSSGGEAAAVGVGGTPFGIGADIGGSIRVPALFCGVFGHKPSAGLVPNAGHWPPASKASDPLFAIGPLTRRAEDLMPLLRLLAGESRASDLSAGAAAPALADPAHVALDELTVTLVTESSLRPFSASLRSTCERAADALATAGATVRTVALRSWRQALLPFLAILRFDPGSNWKPAHALLRASGEPRADLLAMLRRAHGHTLPTRVTLAAESLPISPRTLSKLVARAHALAEELIETIGDGVLLHPAHLTPAPRHHLTYARPWLLTPAAIFNLAGVPVTEVPMGFDAHGLPVGVQVAAAPGADQVSIAVALALESRFGGWRPPPYVSSTPTQSQAA